MRRTILMAAACWAALMADPAGAQSAPTPAERARIERVTARTPLIDGHNDLADQVQELFGGDLSRVDLAGRAPPPLQTDIPRLRAGGVGAQFWSVYVPAALRGAESGQAVHVQIDLIRQMVARHPEVFELATTAADIERIHRAGRIASLLGMEGGEAIDADLAVLRQFRAAGVLYMTLCHAETTSWADSATDAPRHGGLSPFGEAVVREMNRIGMLVDLSHVSHETMRDALDVARAPVIFSHSSAHALTPHPRNAPDDVLRRLRDNGGLVMINFYPGFVSEPVRLWLAERAGEEARQKALHPDDPAAAASGLEAWTERHPRPVATIAQVADHVEHVRAVAGVEHVGLGADFDGVPFTPRGLEDVASYPNLLAELIRRGWSDEDLAGLVGGNLLRVLREAEAAAGQPM